MRSIKEFVDLKKFKSSGRVNLSKTSINKTGLYKLLREFGFRYGQVNGEGVYYQRLNGDVKIISTGHMRDAFRAFFKNTKFKEYSEGITLNNIYEWEGSKYHIKDNPLLRKTLHEELTVDEVHALRMRGNYHYQKQYNLSLTLKQLAEWQLIKNTSFDGNDIYYKEIGNKSYIFFEHFKDKYNQYLIDASIFTFNSERDIINKKPASEGEYIDGFKLDKRGKEFAQKYLN